MLHGATSNQFPAKIKRAVFDIFFVCEKSAREDFKAIKTYSSGMGSDTATWKTQTCGRILYQTRGSLTTMAYQNTCACNIVMYVNTSGGGFGEIDRHLKANETTGFSWAAGANKPIVRGSCDKVGMGGDFPSWHAETDTCRVRPCSLNDTCTNRSSTAN